MSATCYHPYMGETNTEYQRRRCAEDPAYRAKRNEASRRWKQRHVAKIRAIIDEYREGKPCVDCGQVYPAVCMDFDHVRGQKKFGIGNAARLGVSEAAIRAEIAKCELRCSNCHRIRHAEERGA